MKSLLIRLTHGLSEQDIEEEEQHFIQEWLAKKYITHKNNIYKFHSKYRAGVVGLVQKGTAYVHVIGENIKDLYIPEGDLGVATQGDLVIAKRLLGKRGTPSAKIMEIVGREQTYSVGCIIEKEGHHSMVDLKTLYPVGAEMSAEKLAEYRAGDLFKIDNLEGIILEYIGNIEDPKSDEKIVLAQFNKHDTFDEETLKIARSFQEVDAKNYPKRRDLRHLTFCTIDPSTAKDFDDSIYWDEQKSTLYVAIADVSEYVKPFGALDKEAIYRSFSIYLPHKSIPMLPRELSETLCSLQPHKDRLAYVFEIKLDTKTLDVIHSEVYEALMHSDRRFAYEEIDLFFEGKLQAKTEEERSIFQWISHLKKITDRLKTLRLERGFEFHSTEISMELDENTNLVKTTLSQETPSHALIEDCMLLANKEAAKRYKRGLFRVHEPPSQAKLQVLYQELAGIGMKIEIKNSIKETIEAIQKQAKAMGIESEVDTLIIRSQMQAKYSPVNVGHFGLGFDEYTHFTSPIRRYSDLIVHRLLKAIHAGDTQEQNYVLRNIESLSTQISEKEREASIIESEYKARKYARWAQQNLNKEFKARVTATDPELRAELHDEIIGAHLHFIAGADVLLFDDIIVRIEKVDIYRAKIYAQVVGKVNV